MKERLLVGLDVGTSHIRLAAGQLSYGADKRPVLTLIGAAEVPSAGIAKGTVSSLEDAASAISNGLDQAERVIGLPIGEATVGIGGTFITCQVAKGVIGVSRTDGEIRPEDVARAIESARSYVNPANQEILHVLPRTYSVDGQGGIKDPIGMQGIRLEVDTLIIQGLTSHVRNFTKAVFRTGLDVTELVYQPLAAAEAVTHSRERELGVCVCVIGAATTGVVVYENGEVLHAATLPIGADHITSDIAIGLRISLDTAEKLKRLHGTAALDDIPKRSPDLDLGEYGADGEGFISPRDIAEIIQARVEEIFEKVGLELQKIDRAGLLPCGVVVTGGGAKLPGMTEVGKDVLRLPCAIGSINLPASMPEVIQDPAFSTAIGLVQWAFESERRDDHGSAFKPTASKKSSEMMGKASQSIKKMFKSFIP